MAKLIKIFGILFLVFVISVVAFWYLGRGYIEDSLKDKVMVTASPAFTDFSLSKVKISSPYPFQFQLQDVQFKISGVQVELPNVNVRAQLNKAPWVISGNNVNVKLQVESFELRKVLSLEDLGVTSANSGDQKAVTAIAPPAQAPKAAPTTTTFILPWPVHVDFFLSSGFFKLLGPDNKVLFEFSALEVNGRQAPLLDAKAPISFQLKTKFQSDWLGLSYKIPIQASTQESYLVAQKFSAKNLDFSVSGLNMTFQQGHSDWRVGVHDWDTQFEIKDLSQLPNLPDFLPPGKWQGSLQGKLQFKKQGTQPIAIIASLKTSPVEGHVQIDKGNQKLIGKILTQFETSFNYNDQFKLDHLVGYLDLSQAQIQQGLFFAKSQGVPFKIEVDMKYKNGLLSVNKMKALFHKLQASMLGQLSQDIQHNSNLVIKIPHTDLAGYEQFAPIFKSAPLRGSLGLSALVQGNMSQPSEFILKVDDFYLRNFLATVDYQLPEKEFSIQGPLQLEVDGNLQFENMYVKNAGFKIHAIGDQLDFKMAKNLSKKAGGALRLVANLKQQKQKMTFKQTLIKAPGLDMVLEGDIFNEELTKFEIKTELKEFNKAELEKVVPTLAQWGTQPVARGQIKVKGALDPNVELNDLPVEITGGLFTKIPIYKVSSAAAAMGEKPIKVELPPPAAFFPDWPMFKKANLQMKTYIDHFYFDKFHLTKLNFNTYLKEGVLSITGKVEGAYGGEINIESLRFKALEPAPETLVSVQLKNVQTSQALADLLPNYDKEVDGLLSMKFLGKVPYPHGDEWQKGVMAKGQIELKKARSRTFNFDQMAAKALMNAPGVGNQQEIEYLENNYSMKTQYSMAKEKVLFTNLNLYSAEGNQFTSNGYMDFDLNCHFFGDIFLTKAPVRGSVFVANRDKKLRLTAPMLIKGSFTSAEASFSREAIDELLSTAIRYEANRTQAQSRKALEEAVLKQKKELDKKTKNKIDSLFEIK